MPFSVAEMTSNFGSRQLSTRSCHSLIGIFLFHRSKRGLSDLSDFFVEEVSNDEVESESVRGHRIKINDDIVIGRRKAHCDGKNLILVSDNDVSTFHSEC